MQMNNTEQTNKKERKTYTDYDIFPGKIKLIQNDSTHGPKDCVLIIDRDKAIDMAKSIGKNLVQIAYNKNDYPHAICKIIDYGKFKYEQQKRDKEAKKAARAAVADVKEVCFSIRIDDGDYNTKVKHISEFISDGKTKVKITIRLSRREMNLLGMAKDLMRKILTNFDGKAVIDSNPTFNSGIMSCVIRPIKQ